MSLARLLAAFVWMRWRELVHTLFPGRRRGAGKAVSGWVDLVARFVGVVVGIGIALALSIAAGVAGWALLAGPEARSTALVGIRIALAAILLVTAIFPVARASRGSIHERARVLLLPVPRRHLFTVDLLAGLGNPWVLGLAPALLVLTVVQAPSGAVATAVTAVAGMLFLVALAATGAVASIAVELLFRDRRRAELAAIGGVVAWVLVAMIPAAFDDGPAGESEPPAAATAEAARPAGEQAEVPAPLGEIFPWPMQLVPSEAVGSAIASASAGRPAGATLRLLVLGSETLFLLVVARLLWPRLAASPVTASKSRLRAGERPWEPRIPGLSESVSAVAWMQIRTTLRTVQGKIGVAVPVLMMLLLGVLFRWGAKESPFSTRFDPGLQLAFGGVALALLSLQPIMLCQLTVDGTGLTRQFLAPLSDREIVYGKSAAIAILAAGASSLCVLAIASALPGRSLLAWPAVVVGCLATVALLLPPCLWLSLLFPKAIDLSRLGQAGQPHPAAVLIGMLATAVALAPSMAIGGLALLVFGPLGAFALELAWLVAALAFALPLLRFSARLVGDRREATLLALREGS